MEAEKALKVISQERWRWIIQGQIEGKERDYYSSIHNAEVRGAQAKAVESARNMLKDSVSEEQVAKWTALPLDQVVALKKEIDSERSCE